MTSKEIEALANEINQNVADAWLDEVKVVREWDDYRSWLVVEDAPDLDKLYEEMITKMCNSENLSINEEELLRDEVETTKYYEEDLKELAYENFNDDDNWSD